VSADTQAERDLIVRFIRKQADLELLRSDAFERAGETVEARFHARLCDAFNIIAGRIERDEHDE